MRNRQVLRGVAALCVACLMLPALAMAGPADDALVAARKGAEFFKANQFFEAAQEFENAYALDSKDPKNLRYAGRAWQEVGYWERALVLLERYHAVETDAGLKESIVEKLEPLRKATPQDQAAALARATDRFPQAHLEGTAAKAFERLGDEASLKRAVSLLEIARLSGRDDADKQRIDAEIRRLQDKLQELQRKPVEPKPELANPVVPTPVPLVVTPIPQVLPIPAVSVRAAPRPEPAGSAWRSVLFVTGGLLVAGGGGLAWYGAQLGTSANDDLNGQKYPTYSAYSADKGQADGVWYGGLGALGVGAALVIGGMLTGGDAAFAAHDAVRLPTWRPDRTALAGALAAR